MYTVARTRAEGQASSTIHGLMGGSRLTLPAPPLLRQRMIDAMELRGFAARTQEAYMGAVDLMARHYRVQAGSLNRRTCCTCRASEGCRARR